MANTQNWDKAVQYLVNRYRNSYNSAEGPQNPPRQTGQFRVPFVSELKLLNTARFLGQTQFTLTWQEPSDILQFLDHYNVYVIGSQGIPLNIVAGGNVSSTAVGPVTVHSPPCIFNVLSSKQQTVSILVQTVLTNGMASTLDSSPRVGGITFAPTIIGSDFGIEPANTVLAAPDGVDGVPTFRKLVDNDIPSSFGKIKSINGATGPAITIAGGTGISVGTVGNVITVSSTVIGAGNFADNETPSGTINGTTGSDGNPTFTLANSPSPTGSLVLVKNGLVQFQGTAYTLAGSTITYQATYIPVTGDLHRAWYRY